MTRISVVGLGKLGACMAACFASKGHEVLGVDTNQTTVSLVNQGLPPVYEPGLASLMADASKGMRATGDFADAVLATDVTFIVVPTPSTEDGGFSLDVVTEAGRAIGSALRDKDGYHLVVLTSTVLPGATQGTLVPVLEAESGKRCGVDFGVCYSPEFIALGTVVRDFLHPDFILIGESDIAAGNVLEDCLKSTIDRSVPFARMSIANAELAKIAVNTFVTTKISFANMIASICDRMPGGDSDVVTRAIGLDSRIGPQYLRGGMPFGGPCFPRDNRALSFFMRDKGLQSSLPDAVDCLNQMYLDEIIARIHSLTTAGPVAILGLAYKPGSPVLDASPAVTMVEELVGLGYEVRAFDPLASEIKADSLPAGLILTPSLVEAVRGTEMVVVANPDPALREEGSVEAIRGSGARVLFDCWRFLADKATRFEQIRYVGFGVGPMPAEDRRRARTGG